MRNNNSLVVCIFAGAAAISYAGYTYLYTAPRTKNKKKIKSIEETTQDLFDAISTHTKTPDEEKNVAIIVKETLESIQDPEKRKEIANSHDKTTGDTPAHLVISKDSIEALKYLLEGCLANMEAKNNKDQTLLLKAADEKSWKSAEYLVQRGADTSAIDKAQSTIFHSVAKAGYDSFIEGIFKIRDKGIINRQDNWGQTPLHIAAFKNDLPMALLFVIAGAELNILDKLGNKTPAEVADEEGHSLTAQLIKSSTTNPDIQLLKEQASQPELSEEEIKKITQKMLEILSQFQETFKTAEQSSDDKENFDTANINIIAPENDFLKPFIEKTDMEFSGNAFAYSADAY
jgi:ankyrin repeat protein